MNMFAIMGPSIVIIIILFDQMEASTTWRCQHIWSNKKCPCKKIINLTWCCLKKNRHENDQTFHFGKYRGTSVDIKQLYSIWWAFYAYAFYHLVQLVSYIWYIWLNDKRFTLHTLILTLKIIRNFARLRRSFPLLFCARRKCFESIYIAPQKGAYLWWVSHTGCEWGGHDWICRVLRLHVLHVCVCAHLRDMKSRNILLGI